MKIFKTLIIFLVLASTLPFLLLFTEVKWEFISENNELFIASLVTVLSKITGLIGIVLFFWQIILGNRFLIGKIFPDYIWMSKVHKYLGIYATILVFAHPLFQMYLFGENLLFLIQPEFSSNYSLHLTYGRLSYLLFTIIWLSSALLRKKLSYRIWHYIHALTYPLIFFALIHAREIGSSVTVFPFLETIYNTLLVVFVLIVLHRWIWIWSGLGKKKYTIESIKEVPGEVLWITLKTKGKAITSLPGQYSYISIRRFGETHPFSILKNNPENGELQFGIKMIGKFTKKMKSLSKGDTLYIDGPYGVFTKEGHNNKQKVFIAGGIGITPFVEAIKKFGNDQTYLINCNRDIENAFLRKELKEKLGENYIDVLSDEKVKNDPSIVCGMLTKDVLEKRLNKELLESANFFFCGNPGFYKATRKNLMELGVDSSRIYFEEFSL